MIENRYICTLHSKESAMHEGIKDIYNLLDNKRLKEALVQLQAVSTQVPDWKLRNRIEELQETYGYMLQYARKGIQDPNRLKMYSHILRSAYELTDWTHISLLLPHAPGPYFEILRTFNQRPAHSYPELLVQLESYTEDISTVQLFYNEKERQQTETQKICHQHENAINELFNKVWTHIFWNESDTHEVQKIIDSLLVSSNDKAILMSAVTMSLMHLFDERKFQCLLKACQHEDLQVSQRALVGLAIIIDRLENRIQLYPNLVSQLSLLKEEEKFRLNLFTIQMQLLMTRETSKITKKMNEDIIPGIMKATQMKEDKIRFDIPKDEEDFTPEWEDWMDKSGVTDQIREMGTLQLEGADIYMSTFSMMKHFPFFNPVSHWFYPFDMNQIEILPITQELGNNWQNTLGVIFQSDVFCNSDKYSFCLTLANMPTMAKEQAFKQMMGQMEMDDEQKSKLQQALNRSKAAKNISRQYIQDLYRFSKVWVNKHPGQEVDIFTSQFKLWENPLLDSLLQTDENLKGISDFLFHKEHYSDAFTLFNQLMDKGEISAELHQKIGYILQKQKKYPEAIEQYKQADLISADHIWTIRHMAQCYKYIKDYPNALAYYLKAEKIQPDNLAISQQIGECLVKMHRFEEAISTFYKVEYLDKNPIQARRAIAWCSFCTGKNEEALKYYNLLLHEEHPIKQDWLNAGHVYLALNDMQQALAHYQNAHDLCKSHTEFIQLFNEDKEYLSHIGIPTEDLYILLDNLL